MANKKSKWYKNYSKIWIILVAIIAVFFVPKLIDYLYLVGSDKVNTTFESKDILSFWGALLGGVVTLIGVIITVKHSEKKAKEERVQAEEDRKMQIRPNLVSSHKCVTYNNLIEQNAGFWVINLKSDRDHVCYSPVVPPLLGYKWIDDKNINLITSLQLMKKFLFIDYSIENIGNNTACNIKLKIDGIPAPTDFYLAKMNSKTLKLIISLMEFTVGEEKDIEFTYDFSNIDGSVEYQARESFTVSKDNDENLWCKQQPYDILKIV